MPFKYADDLLKHEVRTSGWLPVCRNRLNLIRRAAAKKTNVRRLRYFTFCAVEAMDVLMLDVAKIIRRSADGKFDTVFFFDRTPADVDATQRSIPGAMGFPGDFVKVVLLEDPDEDMLLDSDNPLSSETESNDERGFRSRQRLLSQKHDFINCFPFDVINLDLEEFMLRPSDPFPGRLIQALRKIFAWQRRPLTTEQVVNQRLEGFSLMFTTRIGPPNLTDQYLGMLRDRLTMNLQNDQTLRPLLLARTGLDDVAILQNAQFDTFFKLGIPKIVASILMEEDWFVDSVSGIKVFEFERPATDGPYKMLHLVMDARRHQPPREERAPGVQSALAMEEYRTLARQIFARPEIVVTLDRIDREALKADLERIRGRRKKYYDPDVEDA
jgi:hypothetical protein